MLHGKALVGLLLCGSASVMAGAPWHSQTATPGSVASQMTPARVILPKPAVTWVYSPNADARTNPEGITCLVIHDTQTPGVRSAKVIANHFANPHSEAAAHFIIGKAGEIIQCVDESRRAWHVGPSLFEGVPKVNDYAIGIELVNAEDGVDPFTDAQYQSLAALSGYIVSRYGIPFERIVGHRDVAMPLGRKQDPADNFDWDRFRHDLGTRLAKGGYYQQAARRP
jgi:N-acetylmuramoyl-L-alanine amidase